MITIVRTRQLAAPRFSALGWDVPLGHADDPADRTGRAALAARFIGQSLAGHDVLGAAKRRQELTPYGSHFSFWELDLCAEAIADGVYQLNLSPCAAEVQRLVDAQLSMARWQVSEPQRHFLNTMHRAAWGWSNHTVLGTENSLAQCTEDGFADYLSRCAREGQITAKLPARAAASADATAWRGDLALSPAEGRQIRLGVQVVLGGPASSAAGGAILADWLGGPGGLLVRRLRGERGLIYGSGVQAQQYGDVHTVTLGVSAVIDDLDAVVDGLASMLSELDSTALPADDLARCAERVRHRLTTALDGPFGRLEETRRVRDGAPTAAETLAELGRATAVLAQPGRVAPRSRAVAYVGPADVDPNRLEVLR